MRNTIYLRGEPRHEEAGIATPYDITPGMLVQLNADGYEPHNEAGGAAAALFARENWENDGAGIGDDIDAGDEVRVIYADKGDKINALTDETIERGDYVESAGDGKVRPFGSGVIIGVADTDTASDRVHIIVI